MSVGKVSFGSVYAVSGKINNMKKLDSLMRNTNKYLDGKIMQKDVTSHYKYAPSTGLMAQSAQRGEPVQVYITGKDLVNAKNREEGWDTLDGILSNLSGFLSLYRLKPEEVVKKIVNS